MMRKILGILGAAAATAVLLGLRFSFQDAIKFGIVFSLYVLFADDAQLNDVKFWRKLISVFIVAVICFKLLDVLLR